MEILVKMVETGDFLPLYGQNGRFCSITSEDRKHVYVVKDFIELNKYLQEKVIYV
jgi:hypothetical protein